MEIEFLIAAFLIGFILGKIWENKYRKRVGRFLDSLIKEKNEKDTNK